MADYRDLKIEDVEQALRYAKPLDEDLERELVSLVRLSVDMGQEAYLVCVLSTLTAFNVPWDMAIKECERQLKNRLFEEIRWKAVQ